MMRENLLNSVVEMGQETTIGNLININDSVPDLLSGSYPVRVWEYRIVKNCKLLVCLPRETSSHSRVGDLACKHEKCTVRS